MEDLTGLFFSKYSALDSMCRRKYGYSYNEDGTRDNRSGVLAFAKELPLDLAKELTDIHYKRNDVAHENKFQVRPTQEVIDRLDFFIELFKSKYSEPKFDEMSPYIRATLAKMDTRIGELTLVAKHLPTDQREKILKKCANYVNSVKSAGTQDFVSNTYLAFENFAIQVLTASAAQEVKKPLPQKVAVKAAKGAMSNCKEQAFWQEKQLDIAKQIAVLTKLVGEYPTQHQTVVDEAQRLADEIKSAQTVEDAERAYKILQTYVEENKELIKLQKDKLREMKKFVQSVQNDDEYTCSGDIKVQICNTVEDYVTEVYAATNKTELDGVWERFKAYRGVQKKKYRAQSQQTSSSATSSQARSGFGWGKVIAIASVVLVVAAITCLIVFRKNISWNAWQHIIGSIGGLTFVAIVAFILLIIDENIDLPLVSSIGLGIVAIANMVVGLVVGADYRIIGTWLSAYAILWGLLVIALAVDEFVCEYGWIAPLCEIVVLIVGIILVWTLI